MTSASARCCPSIPRTPRTSPATPKALDTRPPVVRPATGTRRVWRRRRARPTRDLCDVEHRVAALHPGRVPALGNAVIRPQDQVRHADIEPAMQLRLPAPDGMHPADRDGKPAQRFPSQVVVELAAVVAMQGG